MIVLVIYLLVYSLYLMVFLRGGRNRLLKKNGNPKRGNSIGLENITVVIPFRNEEKRIAPLLNLIRESDSLPFELIFVDDHSVDQSDYMIQQLLTDSIKCIALPPTEKGKKRAIYEGVMAAKTEYILTLDADIQWSNEYFLNLGQLKEADLHVLPVTHTSSLFLNRFLQQDVFFATILNLSITGWCRPIFCSGANLLFKKEAYLEAVSESSYFEIDSGDDVFLLREFQKNKKQIEVQTDSSLEVETTLPQSFSEFFNQRMRWLGKAFKVGDTLANALAQIQFIFAFTNLFFLAGCWFFLPINSALFLTGVKTVFELLFSFDFYKIRKSFGLWILVPVYLLLLPILNGVMLMAFLGYKPRWKGRLIVQ